MRIYYIPAKKYSPDDFLKANMRRELKKFKDKRTQIKMVSCMAFIAVSQINMYANVDIDKWQSKLDAKGNKVLSIVQILGYWISIIAASIEIIKSFKKQDIAGLFGIAFKYAALFGLLKGLPIFFEFIGEMFEI